MGWIEVTPEEPTALTKAEGKEVKGIKIFVMVSPYCVPSAVKGEYSEDRHLFEIRFRYLDEEEFRKTVAGEHIWALIGVKSQRLFGFDVDVDKMGVNGVLVAIRTIDQQLIPSMDVRRRPNLDAAREILTDRESDLLASAR